MSCIGSTAIKSAKPKEVVKPAPKAKRGAKPTAKAQSAEEPDEVPTQKEPKAMNIRNKANKGN